jgi:hypothetical protein
MADFSADRGRPSRDDPAREAGRKDLDSYYVAVVKPGRMLYEMDGMTEQVAHEALKLAQAKLPVLTRIIHRSDLTI